MAQEIELKFQIPAARRGAVERAVATRSARGHALAAVYVDTPGEHLAAARIALRLRLEDGQWVQTLKAEDAIALVRHEHNVPLGPARGGATDPSAPPAIDPDRHAGTPAHALLLQALARAAPSPGGADLQVRYRTQVQRRTRAVRHQGAVIELALDQGLLLAGTRQLPLAELELELVRGPTSALLDLAGRWASRFGLVLDVRSKSERGQGLARLVEQGDGAAEPTSPPARARALAMPRHATPAQAGALMVANTLQQALANASQLANGPGTVEHVHQLRVALRRLRTVLGLFPPLFTGEATGPMTSPITVPITGPNTNPITSLPRGLSAEGLADLQQRLAALFQRLGEQRDQDVMRQEVWPRLQAAGSPELPAPGAPAADRPALPASDAGGASVDALQAGTAALLASPEVQTLWLQLLALAVPDVAAPAASAAPPTPAQPLAPVLLPPIKRLLRQVRADAAGFAQLSDQARHRLRRRIKRLRYATELCARLWPKPAVAKFLKALQRVQTPLGALNDNVLALAHYRALAAQVPQAWFAVGWLTAQRGLLLADCDAPMAQLAGLRGCWRGGKAAAAAHGGHAATRRAPPSDDPTSGRSGDKPKAGSKRKHRPKPKSSP